MHSKLQIRPEYISYGSSDIQAALMNKKIRELAGSISKYDINIWRHAIGTASVSELIMDDLEITGQEREDIIIASLLHDVGETELPRELFQKDALSKKDLSKLHKHPLIGAKLVDGSVSNHVIMMILSHHKTKSGGGYGIGIPDLHTEIIKTADQYSALIEDRPYRKGFSLEETLKIMEQKTENGELGEIPFHTLRKYLDCCNSE